MKDESEISADELTICSESVSWVNASTAEKSTSTVRFVKRIAFKNHLVGGAEGLGIISSVVFVGSWGAGGFSREGIGGSQGWE
jgi:hypothetical protein